MPARIRSLMDLVLGKMIFWIMSLLGLDVVWQVFTRYILADPSSVTDELARFLLIWVSFLGGAYVTGQKGHIAIDLISQRWGSRLLNLLIHVIIGLFALAVMVIGGIRWVTLTFELDQTSAALQIPIGYIYLIMPISGVFVLMYTILNLMDERN